MTKVHSAARFSLLISSALITGATLPGADVLIEVGDTWKFFRGTTAPSSPMTLWRQPDFDDAAWEEGATGIGYGDGDDQTVLSDMRNSYAAIFARKEFDVPDPAAVVNLFFQIDYDDGFVAYLNGTEVARLNVAAGDQPYNQTASGGHEAGTMVSIDFTAFLNLLAAGRNVMAVEVRNTTLNSSDLSFIPRLSANDESLLCPSGFACSASQGEVTLTWQNNGSYDWITVKKNGDELPGSPFPGDTDTILDPDPGEWDAGYELTAILDGVPCTALTCTNTVQSRGEGTLQCELFLSDGSTKAELTWTNLAGTEQAEIIREGTLIDTLNGGEEIYFDEDVESMEPEDDTDFRVVLHDGEGRTATMTCGALSLCSTLSCSLIWVDGAYRIRLSLDNVVKDWESLTILRSEDGGPDVTVTNLLPGDTTEFIDNTFSPKFESEYQYTLHPVAPAGEQVNCDKTCTLYVPIPEVGSYDPPEGGWDYSIDFEDHPGTPMTLYNSAKLQQGNLDGKWIRALRDQWDGSAPDEVGAAPSGPPPGGIEIVYRPGMGPCGGDIQALRIVDPGDPNDPGTTLSQFYPDPFSEPSNKAIFLGYDTAVNDRNLLRSGVTFAARWRLDPDAPEYMNAGAAGDGSPLVGGALGNVGFLFRNQNQAAPGQGASASVSFSMNSGDILQFSADSGAGGPWELTRAVNTIYRSLWVTVEDPEGDDTYNVTVYTNGQIRPFSFVTGVDIALDDENFDFGEPAGNYLAIGLPHEDNDAAIEIDFVAYKEGVHPPTATSCHPVTEKSFIRGDSDLNGIYELTDAILIIGYLFWTDSPAPLCMDAIDADDSGVVDLTDIIILLGFMFKGEDPLPFPGGTCGLDPTTEDPFNCEESGCP